MGGKIEVMNSIDTKAGQASSGSGQIPKKGGTGGLPTPAPNGFIIGNSNF